MAYKVIILYQLYMPSYFLGTFTEYPFVTVETYLTILKVPLNQVSSDSSDLCTDRIQFFIDMLIPPVDLVDIMNCTDSLSR